MLINSVANRSSQRPALPLLKDPVFIDQRRNFVNQLTPQLSKMTVQLAECYADIALVSASSSITKNNFHDFNQYPRLIEVIERDVSNINLTAQNNTNIASLHNDLSRLKLLLNELKNSAPAAKTKDIEVTAPDKNYNDVLSKLLTQVDKHQKVLEQDPQYKALRFLEQAERYIHSPERQWNPGYQWTKHTLEGKNIAIPKHVARQLAEIKAAKEDGDYVTHMNRFVDIGRKEANSFFKLFSSTSSKRYSTFFAGSNREKTMETLDNEFKPKNPGNH